MFLLFITLMSFILSVFLISYQSLFPPPINLLSFILPYLNHFPFPYSFSSSCPSKSSYHNHLSFNPPLLSSLDNCFLDLLSAFLTCFPQCFLCSSLSLIHPSPFLSSPLPFLSFSPYQRKERGTRWLRLPFQYLIRNGFMNAPLVREKDRGGDRGSDMTDKHTLF